MPPLALSARLWHSCSMTEDSENPFWAYSLTLYLREGVTAACLDLQERLDLDVNLLLFCCWAGSQGRVLSDAEVEDLIAATSDWRERVVQPLRGARRWLKETSPDAGSAAAELREDIKASELAAEAIQQTLIHRALPVSTGTPLPSAMAANLRSYLAARGSRPGVRDIDALADLLRGACSNLAAAQARRLVSGEAG